MAGGPNESRWWPPPADDCPPPLSGRPFPCSSSSRCSAVPRPPLLNSLLRTLLLHLIVTLCVLGTSTRAAAVARRGARNADAFQLPARPQHLPSPSLSDNDDNSPPNDINPHDDDLPATISRLPDQLHLLIGFHTHFARSFSYSIATNDKGSAANGSLPTASVEKSQFVRNFTQIPDGLELIRIPKIGQSPSSVASIALKCSATFQPYVGENETLEVGWRRVDGGRTARAKRRRQRKERVEFGKGDAILRIDLRDPGEETEHTLANAVFRCIARIPLPDGGGTALSMSAPVRIVLFSADDEGELGQRQQSAGGAGDAADDESFVQIVHKRQGGTARFLCPTDRSRAERPEDARWWRDGRPMNRAPPRALLELVEGPAERTGTAKRDSIPLEGLRLSLSLLEPEDQGMYECVIGGEGRERIHRTLLLVERSKLARLEKMRVEVHHTPERCFRVQFLLPRGQRREDAQRATYFLVFHKVMEDEEEEDGKNEEDELEEEEESKEEEDQMGGRGGKEEQQQMKAGMSAEERETVRLLNSSSGRDEEEGEEKTRALAEDGTEDNNLTSRGKTPKSAEKDRRERQSRKSAGGKQMKMEKGRKMANGARTSSSASSFSSSSASAGGGDRFNAHPFTLGAGDCRIVAEGGEGRVRCELACCQADSCGAHFAPGGEEYSFQASIVLGPDQSTPLSQPPVLVRTWDAFASKALDLDLLYEQSTDSLLIRWRSPNPSQLQGRVQSFHLEAYDLDLGGHHLFALHSREFVHQLTAREHDFRLEEIGGVGDRRGASEFAIKVRVVPETRSGRPPKEVMDAQPEHFPFVLFPSWMELFPPDGQFVPTPLIPAPVVDLRQSEPGSGDLLLEWPPPARESGLRWLFVRTARADRPWASDEGYWRLNATEGRMELQTELQLGLLYQFCAAFAAEIHPTTGRRSHGFWRCISVPFYDAHGQLMPPQPTTMMAGGEQSEEHNLGQQQQHLVLRHALPQPIPCQQAKCRCEAVDGGNALMISWEGAEEEESRQSEGASGGMAVVVHYTMDETDPQMDEWETPVLALEEGEGEGEDGDSGRRGGRQRQRQRVKLAIGHEVQMLPDTVYRMMLEVVHLAPLHQEGEELAAAPADSPLAPAAVQQQHQGAAHFDCRTPPTLDFPPPVQFRVHVRSGGKGGRGLLRFSWHPIQLPRHRLGSGPPSNGGNDNDSANGTMAETAIVRGRQVDGYQLHLCQLDPSAVLGEEDNGDGGGGEGMLAKCREGSEEHRTAEGAHADGLQLAEGVGGTGTFLAWLCTHWTSVDGQQSGCSRRKSAKLIFQNAAVGPPPAVPILQQRTADNRAREGQGEGEQKQQNQRGLDEEEDNEGEQKEEEEKGDGGRGTGRLARLLLRRLGHQVAAVVLGALLVLLCLCTGCLRVHSCWVEGKFKWDKRKKRGGGRRDKKMEGTAGCERKGEEENRENALEMQLMHSSARRDPAASGSLCPCTGVSPTPDSPLRPSACRLDSGRPGELDGLLADQKSVSYTCRSSSRDINFNANGWQRRAMGKGIIIRSVSQQFEHNDNSEFDDLAGKEAAGTGMDWQNGSLSAAINNNIPPDFDAHKQQQKHIGQGEHGERMVVVVQVESEPEPEQWEQAQPKTTNRQDWPLNCAKLLMTSGNWRSNRKYGEWKSDKELLMGEFGQKRHEHRRPFHSMQQMPHLAEHRRGSAIESQKLLTGGSRCQKTHHFVSAIDIGGGNLYGRKCHSNQTRANGQEGTAVSQSVPIWMDKMDGEEEENKRIEEGGADDEDEIGETEEEEEEWLDSSSSAPMAIAVGPSCCQLPTQQHGLGKQQPRRSRSLPARLGHDPQSRQQMNNDDSGIAIPPSATPTKMMADCDRILLLHNGQTEEEGEEEDGAEEDNNDHFGMNSSASCSSAFTAPDESGQQNNNNNIGAVVGILRSIRRRRSSSAGTELLAVIAESLHHRPHCCAVRGGGELMTAAVSVNGEIPHFGTATFVPPPPSQHHLNNNNDDDHIVVHNAKKELLKLMNGSSKWHREREVGANGGLLMGMGQGQCCHNGGSHHLDLMEKGGGGMTNGFRLGEEAELISELMRHNSNHHHHDHNHQNHNYNGMHQQQKQRGTTAMATPIPVYFQTK